MADGPFLNFWGTLGKERGAGYDGKEEIAREDVGPFLSLLGLLGRERGNGYDGKAAEAISTRKKQNLQLASIGRMMSRV